MNISEELLRYNSGTDLDLKFVNLTVYSLEIVCYAVALVGIPTYWYLSNLSQRFHMLLRAILFFLLSGMYGIAVTRFGVLPIRITTSAAHVTFSWLVTKLDTILKRMILVFGFQVDVSIVLLAVERCVAAWWCRTYEHSWNQRAYLIGSLVGMTVPTYIFALYAYINTDPSFTKLTERLAYATMACNLVSMTMLLWARRYSRLALLGKHRHLSQSYQLKENLEVVRLMFPIYLLLFMTRIVQNAARVYGSDYFMINGAFIFRIVMHAYNISVAICVVSTPWMLIYLQPHVRRKIYRNRKIETSIELVPVFSKNDETEKYFKDLKSQWD